MARKVSPLKGYKALRAFNAFNTLLLGLKMLPMYLHDDYATFFEGFKEKTDGEKETFLREAVAFVELTEEEVNALVGFCSDKNGVPYGDTNKGNLTIDELHEVIVMVCMEIGKIKIDLVSEDEKKKSETLVST